MSSSVFNVIDEVVGQKVSGVQDFISREKGRGASSEIEILACTSHLETDVFDWQKQIRMTFILAVNI